MTDPASSPRPYFVPENLDYAALPEGVRIAVEEVVQPAYDELVLRAPDPLERAAGSTFVCLLFLEVLDQFDLGRQVAGRLNRRAESTSPNLDDLHRYFRLTSSKERAGNFLLRVRNLRMRYGIPVILPRGPESSATHETGNSEN